MRPIKDQKAEIRTNIFQGLIKERDMCLNNSALRKNLQAKRERLSIIPLKTRVNMIGNNHLKMERLPKRFRGKVGKIISRIRNLYNVRISGANSVGYKIFLVDRSEITPCIETISQKR